MGEKAMGEEKVVVPSTGWTRPFWLRWGPSTYLSSTERGPCPVEIKASVLLSPQRPSIPLPRTQLIANLCGSGTSGRERAGAGSVSLHAPHLPFTVCCFWLLQGPSRARGKHGSLDLAATGCGCSQGVLASHQSVHSSGRQKVGSPAGHIHGFPNPLRTSDCSLI